MKLILCTDCQDIFKLSKEVRECSCGKCKGKYIDNINAVYNDGIPLGVLNEQLDKAVKLQPVAGKGVNFGTFVIPKNSKTLLKVDNFDMISSEDF